MHLIGCARRPATTRSVQPHRHPSGHYEFHYISAGSASFAYRGTSFSVSSGDLFYIAPRVLHGLVIYTPAKPLVQYIITLELGAGDVIEPRLLQRAWPAGTTRAIGASRRLFLEQLTRLAGSAQPLCHHAAALHFAALVTEIMAGDETPNTHATQHIETILAHLHAHRDQPLNLATLAAHTGLDPSYLCRLFKRELGTTPIRYHLDLRLEQAEQLLRSTTAPVTIVAERCGFSDPYHFSRAFKQRYGQAPSACRKPADG